VIVIIHSLLQQLGVPTECLLAEVGSCFTLSDFKNKIDPGVV